MAEQGVVLTRAAYEKLKRELNQLRLGHLNLSRRLQNFAKRPGARSMAIQLYVGKAVATISSEQSGSVYEYIGPAGEEVASGRTFSNCYNRTGLPVEEDTWCLVIKLGRRKYVVPWECP